MFKNIIRNRNEIIKFFLPLILSVILALLFRSLILEPFRIPSGSMQPGLRDGDFILVSKYNYGYSKHSFPYSFLPFSGKIFKSNPNRGDIIIFRLPSDSSVHYIKRVLALPGEKIKIEAGVVYINGKAINRKKINHTPPITQDELTYNELLENGKNYEILDFGIFSQDFMEEKEVPAGHYFVLGDNRDNSQDSRFENVGFIHEDYIVGQAQYTFFKNYLNWTEMNKWFSAIN